MLTTEILNYLQHTPENLNPSIFSGFMEKYAQQIKNFYEYANLTKIEDYLYSIKYKDISYSSGEEYYKKYRPKLGGCSAIVKDTLYGRKFDWNYSNEVTFVTQVAAAPGRYASLGVCKLDRLEKALVETGSWNELYAALPNLTVDGINEAGLVCNINVVPNGDYGKTTGTNPGKPPLCGVLACRQILDKAMSVSQAIELLKNRNVWMPNHEEVHIMISTGTETAIVEFINNRMEVIDARYMTNFYLYDVRFNQDGTVFTPATQNGVLNAMDVNCITPNGSGLERYNMIVNAYDSIVDEDDMMDLLESLNYTNTYTITEKANRWNTELVGLGRTVKSDPDDFDPLFEVARYEYANRSRDTKTTWQTVHSSVYNIQYRTLKLVCQEGSTVHEFSLN